MKTTIQTPHFKNFKCAGKNLKFYFAGLALLGLLSSCNDDDNSNNDSFDDSELLKTAAVIDRINEEDFQMGMETANDESTMESRPSDLSQTGLASCATVTQTSVGAGFPLSFKLDFGSGCTNNGITRSGSITITYTGFLLAQGSQMIVEHDNYVVNGYEVQGTATYTNQTTGGDPQWSRTVVNGQITTPDDEVYTYSGTRTIRQTQGAATALILNDNVFELTGDATITKSNGSSVDTNITTALVKRHDCSYISQGVVHLEGTLLNGDLNYGSGNCDNTAVYTHSGGATFNIGLD